MSMQVVECDHGCDARLGILYCLLSDPNSRREAQGTCRYKLLSRGRRILETSAGHNKLWRNFTVRSTRAI